jgi:hypothetical protein
MECSSLLLVAIALAGDVFKAAPASLRRSRRLPTRPPTATSPRRRPGLCPAFAVDDKALAIVGDARMPERRDDVDHMAAGGCS